MKHLIATVALFSAASVAPASTQMFSAELFGGAVFENELNINNAHFATDSTSILGVRGLYNVTPEISLGFEYSQVDIDYSTLTNTLEARSIFAIARYGMAVADRVEVYGTVGIGSISLDYDNGLAYPTVSGTGGTAAIGLHYAVADNIGIFGEFYHQGLFDEVEVLGDMLEYNSSGANIGMRFRF